MHNRIKQIKREDTMYLLFFTAINRENDNSTETKIKHMKAFKNKKEGWNKPTFFFISK